MRRKSRPFRALCAALVVLAACQDVPTAVISAPLDPSHQTNSAGQHLGEVAFYCVQGRRAAGGRWQTRLDTLFFPRAELDATGRKVQYQYRLASSDGKLLSGADCVVPYTEAALRRLDRFFRVQKGGGAEQYEQRQGMITTQDCVRNEETGCVIDPIVVIAPPPEIPPCDACNYYPGGNGGGGDGGGGDGGGGTGGGETTSPYEQGPLTWVACIGAGLTAIGGGVLSYVAVEQYYMAIRAYGSARLRYEYATATAEQSQYYSEMLAARNNVNVMTVALAGSASVTVGGLLGVVALCSPSVLFPTP